MTVVYFIKPLGMDGPVKIGCSRCPDRRMDTLETWSPFPLEIAASIKGAFQLERRFHAKFADQHTHREWFVPSPGLTADIAAINAGTFDVAALPEPGLLPRTRKPARPWSEERKAIVRLWRAEAKIEKTSGLVCDWEATPEERQAFLHDPHRYGITREERERRGRTRIAAYHFEQAQKLLATSPTGTPA